MKNFSLVYFPEEFNKRHVDEKFRKLVSDLRVGNLKEEHIEYLQNLGSKIDNIDKIRNAMLIVNGDVSAAAVLQKGYDNIFAANTTDRQVVSWRQTKCTKSYEEVYKTQCLWPLDDAGNVQIICSEKKQLQEYQSYYQNSLKNIKLPHYLFKAEINILAYNDKTLLKTFVIKDDTKKALTRQSWYLEACNLLPNDEIVIVQGNTYSIFNNSNQGHRHEVVKVIGVNTDNQVI